MYNYNLPSLPLIALAGKHSEPLPLIRFLRVRLEIPDFLLGLFITLVVVVWNPLLFVSRKLFQVSLLARYALNAFDMCAFEEHHQPPYHRDNAPHGHQKPRRPARTVVSAQPPHASGKSNLEERVPDHGPNHKVKLPSSRWWRSGASQWSLGNGLFRKGNACSRHAIWDVARANVRGQVL